MLTEMELEAKVKQFEGIAKKLASQYSRKTRCEYDDLYQEGMIGLIKAIRTFDSSKSQEMTHYYTAVRGYIMNYIRDKQKTVRVPAYLVVAVNKAFKMKVAEESAEVIAKTLGIKLELAEDIKEYIDIKSECAYLDKPVQLDSGENKTLGDTIVSSVDFEDTTAFYEVVNKMSDHEKKVFELYMQGYSNQEIGEVMGKKHNWAAYRIRCIRELFNSELKLGYNY